MKHRFKRILLFLSIPILLGGMLHYTISYKIKNVLQLLIEKESDNTYAFHASKIEVSFWNKSFVIEKAQFISLDTSKSKMHYTVEIPQMYMQIQSWSDIIFKRKISIDSLSFIDSKIGVYEKTLHKIKPKGNVDIQEVFKTFEKILVFLEVKSFSIQNGSFSYKTIHSPKTLSGQGINFSIRNLSEKNKKGHLLYSEDITLDMKNQEWHLPDGIHTVSFKRLSFSGKNQFFELDSFTINSAANADKEEINLYTEKFFFNSVELESMYQNNTLAIDTLLCIRPVLTLSLAKNKATPADTSKSIAKFLPGLFKASHINYINIEDGQILLKNKKMDSTDALVQKSNLKIYNLSLNENRVPFLKTDSILFGLKDIKFITPDSTFEIVASELLIINNDLVLRNSFFGPAHTSTTGKSISFSAPEFRLNDINFVDLIQRKLNAKQAELYRPNIIIKSLNDNASGADTAVTNIEHFYSSLHGFRELVGVERLNIIDGNIHIRNSGKQHTSLHMEGIDALILPINVVNSSALLDIKHALPDIKIAKISIESDHAHITINRFAFNGVQRKNYADHVHLKMRDELDIEGNTIYWEIFDWDLFQKYKRIDIKEFSAQKLSVKAGAAEEKKSSDAPRKNLPDIRVGKLNIGQLLVHSAIADDTFSFTAHNVTVDSLRTQKRFFAWKKVDGIYENIHMKKDHVTAHIQLLKFDALTQVILQNISLDKKDTGTNIHVKIPSVIVLGNFYSTDFSSVSIQKLNIQDPVINYSSISDAPKKPAAKKEFSIPINIKAKELIVSNASVHYKETHVNDTISYTGNFTVKIENIAASKTDNRIIQFDACQVNLHQLHFAKNAIDLDIPVASINVTNGSLNPAANHSVAFESNIAIRWEDMHFSKAGIKNNGVLQLKNVSGSFIKNQFSYTTHTAIPWQSLLTSLSIDKGTGSFLSDHAVFKINEITWQNKLNLLSFNNISYHPKLELEDAIKYASTQFDYLTLTGKSIRIKNMNIGGTTNDSIIHIQNILLDHLELSSTRDKNVPRKIVKLKEMPTKIIQAIPIPLAIDSVNIRNSKVVVHQIEANTYAKAMIPIDNIHATITNIRNRAGVKDSLYLTAHADILGVAIRSFAYTESYADSLSYFHASSHIVPGKFTSLNPITIPLAAVSIDNGYSNKLHAEWSGNKYATIGQMDFIYKDLAVHVLSKNDTSHTNLALLIENKVAKEIINKNNKKPSVIFFERNTEKQIFNYWLKATLQGVYSSVGLKRNDKYLKHYSKVKDKYHLPADPAINK